MLISLLLQPEEFGKVRGKLFSAPTERRVRGGYLDQERSLNFLILEVGFEKWWPYRGKEELWHSREHE